MNITQAFLHARLTSKPLSLVNIVIVNDSSAPWEIELTVSSCPVHRSLCTVGGRARCGVKPSGHGHNDPPTVRRLAKPNGLVEELLLPLLVSGAQSPHFLDSFLAPVLCRNGQYSFIQ